MKSNKTESSKEEKAEPVAANESIHLPVHSGVEDNFIEAEEIIDHTLSLVEDEELKDKIKVAFNVAISKVHQGPYPSSDELRALNDISPDLLNTVLSFTEREQLHRHKINEKALDLEIQQAKRNFDHVDKELNINDKLANKEIDNNKELLLKVITDESSDRKKGFGAAVCFSIGLFGLLVYALITKQQFAAIALGVIVVLITSFLRGRSGLKGSNFSIDSLMSYFQKDESN